MNPIPLPRPGLPLPWWMQRDDAVRKAKVDDALPGLVAALEREAAPQGSQGGVGLLALFLGALGIAWGASR